MGASTVSEIVKATCEAIVIVLSETMKVPNEADEWKVISTALYVMYVTFSFNVSGDC